MSLISAGSISLDSTFNHIIKLPSTNNGCFLVKGGPVKGGVGQLGTVRTRVVALNKRTFNFSLNKDDIQTLRF